MRKVTVTGSAVKRVSPPARFRSDRPAAIVCGALALSLFFLAWRIASVW
jgi:hypothetical protein